MPRKEYNNIISGLSNVEKNREQQNMKLIQLNTLSMPADLICKIPQPLFFMYPLDFNVSVNLTSDIYCEPG